MLTEKISSLSNYARIGIVSVGLTGASLIGISEASAKHKEWIPGCGYCETNLPGQGATLDLEGVPPSLAAIMKKRIAGVLEKKLEPYCDKVTSNFLEYQKEGERYADIVLTCWDENKPVLLKTYGLNLDNACAGFLDQKSILGLFYIKNEVINRTADGEATTSPNLGNWSEDDAGVFAEIIGRYALLNNEERCRDLKRKVQLQESPEGLAK